MLDDQQQVQNPECRRGDGEGIDGGNIFGMVAEKRPPRLRRPMRSGDKVLRDRRLGDLNP